MIDFALVSGFILGAIVSIIVISNPISTSAVFVSLTEGMKRKDKVEIAKRSVKFSLVILVFFALTGFYLFQLFGFSIGAFRIAGGILLFTMAVHMMNHKQRHTEATELDYNEISLMPLSVPFTAGPGTIVTVVLLSSEALNMMSTVGFMSGLLSVFGVYAGILTVVVISYLMMVNSQRIDDIVKEGGRHVITRLMGLLVMAIAIQFMINGVIDIIPDLIAAAV
ncbi:MAG: MarC family protein [Candidatus Aenigmatarchaeota archaeon]|nr:MAG: MarC family protein [Candidatus Aenigmarchaeota archaeon]